MSTSCGGSASDIRRHPAPGRRQFGLYAGGYRDAEAARRVRSPPDRAAAGARRHHRPRPTASRPRTRRSASTRASTRPTTRGRPSRSARAGSINIKVSRVGGLREAKRIHDVCYAREVPVWCGGMHEFGIGRAANVAIASLPGFTLPGDISGSDKYYREDIVDPPIVADRRRGRRARRPGLGHSSRSSRSHREGDDPFVDVHRLISGRFHGRLGNRGITSSVAEQAMLDDLADAGRARVAQPRQGRARRPGRLARRSACGGLGGSVERIAERRRAAITSSRRLRRGRPMRSRP